MPHTVEHVRGRHVRRCVITANDTSFQALVLAALEAQAAGRGDAILPWIIGARIITAAGPFTLSNVDGTGTLTLAAASVPYEGIAVNVMADTFIGGAVALGVEVYFTGNPTVP